LRAALFIQLKRIDAVRLFDITCMNKHINIIRQANAFGFCKIVFGVKYVEKVLFRRAADNGNNIPAFRNKKGSNMFSDKSVGACQYKRGPFFTHSVKLTQILSLKTTRWFKTSPQPILTQRMLMFEF
jgi:hypothetical protein